MSHKYLINIQPFLLFLLFVGISFLDINRKNKLIKNLFLCSLLGTFCAYFFIVLNLTYEKNYNYLTLILYLTFSIILLIYFFSCLIDFKFIRLRLLFVPYFCFVLIVCYFSFYSLTNLEKNSIFFENKLLTTHIITSLLAYSFLTNSAISSIAVFAQERNLKNSYSEKSGFFQLLPSIYESEIMTIRLLYATQIFLLLSLISGYFYSNELSLTHYIMNEKSIISILTFILIWILLFIRKIFGLSGKRIFNSVLFSYLLINFGYFGYKLIN
tara:strand:+ start:204 stop:1013 length:810 start_codon:yes stop_codon:yes gene_type:complete